MTKSKGSASIAQLGLFDEIFVPVQGYGGRFEISNKGKLISINGKFNGVREMKKSMTTKGYYAFQLKGNGIKHFAPLHRLLAIHFLPNPNDYPIINHKDGNKLNNNLSNLEWCTYSQNIKHAIDTGLNMNIGNTHCHAKLTDDIVLEIRKLRKENNMTHKELSKRFGITRRHIGDIINRICWKHI